MARRMVLRLVAAATIAACAPLVVHAAGEGLNWAYPVSPPAGTPNPEDAPPVGPVNEALVRTSYTGLPQAPAIVATSKPTPCVTCHLANGNGHPPTADVSGLSANYIVEQVHAYRDGQRVDKRTGRMVAVAKAISEADLTAAAEYYAAIGPERQEWIKTVVGTEVPKHYFFVGPGGIAFKSPEGGTVPIPKGQVVVMSQDEDMVRVEDQLRGGFVQYVRPEQMQLGQRIIADGDGGRLARCSACHGADLKGQGDVPRLLGRQTLYIIRAMNDMRTGANKNPRAAPMAAVAARMTDEDIVGAAVYLASKAP
jgi:cytochrome c553